MEQKIQDAVDRKVIPGAVIVATNLDGIPHYFLLSDIPWLMS
jgi:hypothetical protein